MTDHFVANFTGSASNLSAYTPDVGAAFTVPSGQSCFWTYNYYPPAMNALQHVWHKDGAGYAYTDIDSPVGWYENTYLQVNTDAATPDYYIEVEIDWSGLGSGFLRSGLFSLCVRGTPTPAPEDYEAGLIGMQFYINVDYPTDGNHRIEMYWDYNLDADDAGSVSAFDDDYPIPDFDTTATHATFRVEVEGSTLRAFINGALQSTATFTATGHLTTAKKAFFHYWPAWQTWKVNYLKLGDEFLAPPPGDFWQDFVKSVEA